MNSSIVNIDIVHFLLIYILLLIVLAIMKKNRMSESKQFIIASIRMTLQLVIAGFVLTYILKDRNPLWTLLYLAAMITFSIFRVFRKTKWLNRRFKLTVALSMSISGLAVLAYFVGVVIGVSVFDPQYTIPIGGMIMGNTMTGVSLALKSFGESLSSGRKRTDALLGMGVAPYDILRPLAVNALSTAMLPTMNTMLGMGIISLPGMMTGQILSGTVPTTAILYQAAIYVCICTSICLAVFCALNFGFRTLCNERAQISIPEKL